jgi:hypothetical protein
MCIEVFMDNLRNAARETVSYRRLLASGKKHLNEQDYMALRKAVLQEAWGRSPLSLLPGGWCRFS